MILTRRSLIAGGAAATVASLVPLRAIAFTQPGAPGDAAILRQAFGALHPGLTRYTTPAQLAAAFARLEIDLAAPGQAARFLALSRLTGLVRCGHTYPNPANHRSAVAAALFGGPTRLPFRFRWLGRQMVVTDGQQSGLARGTEILAVDGRPAAQILAALLPLARADGGNDGKRRRLLSVEGQQRVETFDVYHPLVFPPRDARATLAVRTPAGRRRTVVLERIDLAGRQAAMAGGGERPQGNPGWSLRHDGAATIMTMDDWALYNNSWDWRGWIDEAFATMAARGSTSLILDLRANEGGLDCGNSVAAHLVDTPIPVSRFERRVRYRRAPEALRPYLDTWDRSFDTLGEGAEDLGDGFFRLPRDAGDETIAPRGPRFSGRFMVLIGPQNSSATFQFAGLVRAHRLGRLIGETTGGNRRGINGGGYYFLRLPDSGLEVDVPLIGYFPPNPEPDAGVAPDVAVAETIASIAAGRDLVMERALALARG